MKCYGCGNSGNMEDVATMNNLEKITSKPQIEEGRSYRGAPGM